MRRRGASQMMRVPRLIDFFAKIPRPFLGAAAISKRSVALVGRFCGMKGGAVADRVAEGDLRTTLAQVEEVVQIIILYCASA